MKILAVMGILLSFSIVEVANTKTPDPIAVEQEKWKYEDMIIPSYGCSKDDVEKVFGQLSVVNDKPFRAPTNKPYHIYTLLPSDRDSHCKVCLCVVYNQGLVLYSWINYNYIPQGHSCPK